ncbi:hypothetical protein ACWIGW_44175 [Nocardia brasiliensis]
MSGNIFENPEVDAVPVDAMAAAADDQCAGHAVLQASLDEASRRVADAIPAGVSLLGEPCGSYRDALMRAHEAIVAASAIVLADSLSDEFDEHQEPLR